MPHSYFLPSLARLGLTALLTLSGLAATQAQNLNYFAANATNVAGTYTDLGTTGTAITTANTDDANSTVQNIGFTFNYNGTAYTQFTLNTNGFVKLGATAPSGTQLFASETSSSLVDVFQSADDPNIIAPFNTDLTAGAAGGTEYRVYTSGSTGSRICTIQWKNVADKTAANPTQYTNLSFQVKLYEATGIIEFVYAAPTVATTSADRFAQVGLKGTSFDIGQVVQVVKDISDPWSAATFATYVDILTNQYLSTVDFNRTTAPTAGRTFRFTPSAACPTTPAVVSTFPYTENFDSVDIPYNPCGITVLDVNNDNNGWFTASELLGLSTASAPNAMVYAYSSTQAANDWFFTRPLSLQAGLRYQLQFKYAADNANYPEALEVKAGLAATPAGQTIPLFSNTNIINTTYATTTTGNVAAITPTTSGTYYIGFHAISLADQDVLLVDDITVTATPVLATRGANNGVFKAEASPVPFGETLSLSLNTLKAGPLQLTLSDALGRTVRRITTATLPSGSSTVAVPEVSNLQAGVYFLTIEQGGASQTIRVAHQ